MTTVGRGHVVARPPDLPALAAIVAEAGSLYDAALTIPRAAELRGRGLAPVVDLGGMMCVVRHYRRGGAVARVLDDRYVRWGGNRLLHEIGVSELARARDVATPLVQCGAWYPDGPFVRFDIATEYIQDSRDLSTLFFGDAAPAEPVLAQVAQLIRAMLRAGLVHRDLNIKNIIVDSRRAWVLDLDCCRIDDQIGSADIVRMRERFFRSVNKWELSTGRRVHDVARNVLSEAFHA